MHAVSNLPKRTTEFPVSYHVWDGTNGKILLTRSCCGQGKQHPYLQNFALMVSVVPFFASGSLRKGEGHSASTKPSGIAAKLRPASLLT